MLLAVGLLVNVASHPDVPLVNLPVAHVSSPFTYQVKSFKQGKFALRGAVAMAVRNANNPDGAAAAAGGAGGADAGGDAKGAAAPSGPMTRNARRGGRRPREEEGAKPNKRQKGQAKFKALNQNNDVHFLTCSLDGDSVRESFK